VRVQKSVVTKVKLVESIIIVFYHPTNSTLEGNIIARHTTIDHVYNEPDSWDIWVNAKNTCPKCCIRAKSRVNNFNTVSTTTTSIE
jgi:hypothetical protein